MAPHSACARRSEHELNLEDRDLPVLDAIVRALVESPLTVTQVRDIANATG